MTIFKDWISVHPGARDLPLGISQDFGARASGLALAAAVICCGCQQ